MVEENNRGSNSRITRTNFSAERERKGTLWRKEAEKREGKWKRPQRESPQISGRGHAVRAIKRDCKTSFLYTEDYESYDMANKDKLNHLVSKMPE